MKQLLESKINNGEYDSLLNFLIESELKEKTILSVMMKVTKGHENPRNIIDRIKFLLAPTNQKTNT